LSDTGTAFSLDFLLVLHEGLIHLSKGVRGERHISDGGPPFQFDLLQGRSGTRCIFLNTLGNPLLLLLLVRHEAALLLHELALLLLFGYLLCSLPCRSLLPVRQNRLLAAARLI